MPKKVYVKRYGHEDGPERVKTRIIKDFDEMPKHKKIIIDDECCGEHKHHERKHRHFEKEMRYHEKKHRHRERKHKHHHVHVRPRFDRKQTTKMFTSKDELVKYVNEVGELGHNIDIFKIEEDLYKVVVLEVVEVKTEVEVETTPDEEEIEVEVEIEEETE